MSSATDSPLLPFERDRLTWLAYAMLAFFGYMQTSLGPLMPFLRDELGLSYTVTGLHLSAFALGMVLAGALGERFAARWGRVAVLWGGGVGMCAGALIFISAHHPALTIFAALLMGLPGTLVMAMVQVVLSARHGARRAVALTESNIGASFSAGLAPVMVGSLQRVGAGWRSALVVGVAAWGLLLAVFRRVPIPPVDPEPEAATGPAPRALPLVFWAYWLVVFLGVSVEWCIVFWGADFLETSVGLSKVNASTLISVFFVAMVIGRAVGSRLSRTMPVGRLLPLALLVALVGFFPFWLAPVALINVAGMFVAGLGVANLFPLTLSAASGVVTPRQADAASSRITLAAGLAILVTPQVLGSLADAIAIRNAYSVVAVFLVAALGAIWLANRLARRALNP